MHTICCSHSTLDCANGNNPTIFYNFVGNFVPPEWNNLASNNGKILSKTARQLLSLIVFRLQIYHNNNINELHETYHFFEQSLGVCQERVRQCLTELKKGAFIDFYKATIVKHNIKCRNIPCIKLIKNFQPYTQKISHKDEKILLPTPKKFGVKPKKLLAQPQKSLDHSIYIDNKDNISNKSRSNESIVFQNEKNKIDKNEQLSQHAYGYNLEQNPQSETTMLTNDQEQPENSRTLTLSTIMDTLQPTQTLQVVIDKIFKEDKSTKHDKMASDSNNPPPKIINNQSWITRKRLADFYPLTQEDADLLQIKSNREFNLDFINKLLLKLAGEYSNHHFGHKKVLLNYMAKALNNELRETTKVNSGTFQFKSNNENKTKEQYLEKIESCNDTSTQSQLKRKIISIFDSDIAYELLNSCSFVGVVDNNYQLKLLKNIALSEHVKAKILQQIQLVYGEKVQQLQIIPLLTNTATTTKKEDYPKQADQDYLFELSKQLNPDSVWYNVRKYLIERYSRYSDIGAFSNLVVIKEDMINKKIILKSISAFYDYYIRDRHIQDLKEAFQAQGFTFELIKFEDDYQLP